MSSKQSSPTTRLRRVDVTLEGYESVSFFVNTALSLGELDRREQSLMDQAYQIARARVQERRDRQAAREGREPVPLPEVPDPAGWDEINAEISKVAQYVGGALVVHSWATWMPGSNPPKPMDLATWVECPMGLATWIGNVGNYPLTGPDPKPAQP